MRIAVATPLYPPEIGGPATHAVFCERELPPRGIEVAVIPFARVRRLPKGVRHAAYAWHLFRLARHADMVYALDPVSVGLPALIAARLSLRPLVVRVPGDYAWEQGVQRDGITHTLDEFVKTNPHTWTIRVRAWYWIESFVARHAARVVVPSRYLASVVERWGVAPSRIKVVYSAFAGRGAPHTDLGARPTVILSAGRLVPWKGMNMLIRAFGHVRADIPEAVLRIVGDGPERPRLERLVHELSLGDAVTFTGTLPQHELFKELGRARVFALNTAYEGLSHVLLEAIDAGTPVVTTPVGGNPEVITNGKNGLLVAYNDESALECALARLLTDMPFAANLAKCSRSELAKFSSARGAEALAAVLKNWKSETGSQAGAGR